MLRRDCLMCRKWFDKDGSLSDNPYCEPCEKELLFRHAKLLPIDQVLIAYRGRLRVVPVNPWFKGLLDWIVEVADHETDVIK